jgi:uncharacterized lipoprotein YmbA
MNSGRRDQAALRISIIGSIAAAFLIAGCIDLAPQHDPTRIFVLTAPAMGNAPRGDGVLKLGIKRIELPEYLMNPKMVVRKDGFEIVHSDFHRWGEDLDMAIGRIVGNHLLKRNFINSVSTIPWSEKIDHDFEIRIQIDRFEGVGSSAARLEARWTIRSVASGEFVRTGYTSASRDWDGSDYLALTSALSDTLGTLAGEIAGGLPTAP